MHLPYGLELVMVPLPVVLPMLMAAALAAVGGRCPRKAADIAALATAVVVMADCAELLAHCSPPVTYWFGGWTPHHGIALGIGFVVDPAGAAVATFASLIVVGALIFSIGYFDTVRTLYHALMLIFLSAMAGFCLTGDLFNMFVLFELMSVAAFALSGYKIEDASLEGAFNFAVTNSLAAFLVLIGIALLYGRTGALDMAQIGAALASMHRVDGLIVTAFALLVAGFFVKGAIAPFHFWLADAHAVAPTPVCMIFSGVMVELGLYAVARIYWTIFAPILGAHGRELQDVLVGFALATSVIGGILCFAQRHIKRLLAFSSVSHMGSMLAGIALMSPVALAGAGLYALGHGLVKAALFAVAGSWLARFGSVDEYDLHGAAHGKRFTTYVFVAGGLALAGAPPFGLWLGRSLIESVADKIGAAWLPWALAIGEVLTGAAVLRVAGRVCAGWGAKSPPGDDAAPGREARESKPSGRADPCPIVTAPLVLAVAAVALTFLPAVVLKSELTAGRFMTTGAYIDVVLFRNAGPWLAARASESGPQHLTTAVASGLTTALLAIAVAALALRSHASRAPTHAARRALLAPIDALRNLHSGDARDYVAWLTAGAALLAGLVALAVR